MHLMHPKLIWYLWTFSILINKHSFEIWVLFWLDIVKLTIIFYLCNAQPWANLTEFSSLKEATSVIVTPSIFNNYTKCVLFFFSPQHQCLRVLHLLKRLSSLALPIFMPWMVASSSSTQPLNPIVVAGAFLDFLTSPAEWAKPREGILSLSLFNVTKIGPCP